MKKTIFMDSVSIEKKLSFWANNDVKMGCLFIRYEDPDGDPEKKNLIENIIQNAINEAKKILSS